MVIEEEEGRGCVKVFLIGGVERGEEGNEVPEWVVRDPPPGVERGGEGGGGGGGGEGEELGRVGGHISFGDWVAVGWVGGWVGEHVLVWTGKVVPVLWCRREGRHVLLAALWQHCSGHMCELQRV